MLVSSIWAVSSDRESGAPSYRNRSSRYYCHHPAPPQETMEAKTTRAMGQQAADWVVGRLSGRRSPLRDPPSPSRGGLWRPILRPRCSFMQSISPGEVSDSPTCSRSTVDNSKSPRPLWTRPQKSHGPGPGLGRSHGQRLEAAINSASVGTRRVHSFEGESLWRFHRAVTLQADC